MAGITPSPSPSSIKLLSKQNVTPSTVKWLYHQFKRRSLEFGFTILELNKIRPVYSTLDFMEVSTVHVFFLMKTWQQVCFAMTIVEKSIIVRTLTHKDE